jgi:hypothetical protein
MRDFICDLIGVISLFATMYILLFIPLVYT